MDENTELLSKLIGYAHGMGATDLHVSPGLKPDVVVRGRLYAIADAPAPTNEQIAQWAAATVPGSGAGLHSASGSADAVINLADLRVRLAFRRQFEGIALTARLLPLRPPDLADLDIQAQIASLIAKASGLVIVSGPTGAGKSTLLAALVNEVNTHASRHIMTIEDPIEFVHPHKMSRISQREVGRDVDSFASALRAALRARPDIVVVGEMRDQDTVRAAMDAASKGQLVFTTSHASSVEGALEGLVSMFPANEQQASAARLASVLQAVIVQQLVPDAMETGVVPVREILLRTDGVAALIRSRSFNQLYNAMTKTNERGEAEMLRLEDDLVAKLREGLISRETAFATANVHEHLRSILGDRRRGGAA